MSRWLFPLGLVLILFGVVLSYWENRSHPSAETTGSTRSQAMEAGPNPAGDAAASIAPVPQNDDVRRQ